MKLKYLLYMDLPIKHRDGETGGARDFDIRCAFFVPEFQNYEIL